MGGLMESGRKYFAFWGCTRQPVASSPEPSVLPETQGPHSGRMEFWKCRTHWHRTTKTLVRSAPSGRCGHKLFLMRNRRDFNLFRRTQLLPSFYPWGILAHKWNLVDGPAFNSPIQGPRSVWPASFTDSFGQCWRRPSRVIIFGVTKKLRLFQLQPIRHDSRDYATIRVGWYRSSRKNYFWKPDRR